MPATAIELVGRSGQGIDLEARSRRRRYRITDADSEAEAIAAVLTEAPPEIDGIPREPPDVEEVDGSQGLYFGTVDYNVQSATGGNDANLPPEGTKEFSFEIQVKQQKLTTSLSTVARWSWSGLDSIGNKTPDFGKLINVGIKNGVANIEGVEVGTPEHTFSEKHYKTGITEAYYAAMRNVVGKTNEAAFRGALPGEVICVGINGSRRGLTKWEINYNFAFSETRTDIELGATGFVIGPITKGGWEYLWVFPLDYNQVIDGLGVIRVSIPQFVYIEKVYRSADYETLNLGPSPLTL